MLNHSPGFVEALTNNLGTGGSLLHCESESIYFSSHSTNSADTAGTLTLP